MKNLIVCEHPGEELISFGNLLLNKKEEKFDIVCIFTHPNISKYETAKKIFYACCEELGIVHKTIFPLPYFKNTSISFEQLLSYMKFCCIDNYDNIYTYSVQNENKNKQLISAIVGYLTDKVRVLSNSGFANEVVISNFENFSKRTNLLNKYYSELLINHNFKIEGFKNVDTYREIEGVRLYRYYIGCVKWEVNQFLYEKPWELESSSYEQNRYCCEIDALKKIEWDSILEIGGCEGYFTKLLINNFANKKIISIEPDCNFYDKLKENIGDKAQIINIDIKSLSKFSVDVVFISNVLYYCSSVPLEIFQVDAKYFLVSHDLQYHEQVVDKMFLSQNYNCIYEKNLAACIENMEDLLCVKYGTNIKIWSKCSV